MKPVSSVFVLILGLLLGASVLPVQAQSQMEMNQQAAQEFEKTDIELNRAYQKVIAGLDNEGKKKLQAAQRAWIVYRDAEAAFVADGERGGSVVPLVYSSALTELTRERIKVLKKLL